MVYYDDEPFLASPSQIESLKSAFFYDLPPLCSGTVSPPPEGLYLYYGKEDSRLGVTTSTS